MTSTVDEFINRKIKELNRMAYVYSKNAVTDEIVDYSHGTMASIVSDKVDTCNHLEGIETEDGVVERFMFCPYCGLPTKDIQQQLSMKGINQAKWNH